MDYLKDFLMFCPHCRVRVQPKENSTLKQIVREKAQSFAQNYNLKELIQQKNFKVLDMFTKFKKLEENCKFCPKCQWTPFTSLITDNLFKQFKIDFPEKTQI